MAISATTPADSPISSMMMPYIGSKVCRHEVCSGSRMNTKLLMMPISEYNTASPTDHHPSLDTGSFKNVDSDCVAIRSSLDFPAGSMRLEFPTKSVRFQP